MYIYPWIFYKFVLIVRKLSTISYKFSLIFKEISILMNHYILFIGTLEILSYFDGLHFQKVEELVKNAEPTTPIEAN